MGLSWLLKTGLLKQIKRQLLRTTKTKCHQKRGLGGGGVAGNVHRGVIKECTAHHTSPVAHHQYWINSGVKLVHSGPSLMSTIGRTPPKSKNQRHIGAKNPNRSACKPAYSQLMPTKYSAMCSTSHFLQKNNSARLCNFWGRKVFLQWEDKILLLEVNFSNSVSVWAQERLKMPWSSVLPSGLAQQNGCSSWVQPLRSLPSNCNHLPGFLTWRFNCETPLKTES